MKSIARRHGIIELIFALILQNHASHGKNANNTFETRKTLLPQDAIWQPVTGASHRFYVYSAFLEKRETPWVVRIIGAARTKFHDEAICILHYENSRDEITPALVSAIQENWDFPYSAVFIKCDIKNNSHIPSSVSLSIEYSNASANNLVVQNFPDLTFDRNRNKIAVCVAPIYGNYDNTDQLLEFIELNQLLGVSHFIFYNSSASAKTNCVLNHYINKKRISVHSWQLNFRSEVEIRHEGIFAALNDCLYRTMYSYPYVAFMDFDEVITPQFNETLQDLLQWLNAHYDTSKISAYYFRNAFFYLEWNDDPSLNRTNEIENRLLSIRKTRRRVKLNFHEDRSKYIVKAKNIVEVGNHFVWQFLPSQDALYVPSKVALLHHYRTCDTERDICVNSRSLVDRKLHSYRRELTCKIARKWIPLTGQCGLPELNNFDYDQICNGSM